MPDTQMIQDRIDAIAKGMTDKGLSQTSAEFTVTSHARPRVWLNWKKATPEDAGYKFFHGAVEDALSAAEAHVAALPAPEVARMTAFMSALSEAIELGKKVDVDADLVNPLLALMKKLSKNALQHQQTEDV